MFRVDRARNRIQRLEKKRFADLNLRERSHLQEWLANLPDALGEDLLVIQKEFDGFDDTRERLDLLALDKEGRLVVIENKLDDTGCDVVWQSIKYAAYVSSLTRVQIVDVFQAYLDRWAGGGNAAELICEFMDADDLDEVVLNPGNSQRVVMIAATFRKEITATALWLLSHGLRVQCFRATPWADGEALFLDIQQIIPVPEAGEFMIGIASKDSEEKAAQGAQKTRHVLRLDFWRETLEAMRRSGATLFQNISPGDRTWISTTSGVPGCQFSMIFVKSGVWAELYLNRASPEENKRIFDALIARRDEIEAAFGAPLEWERLDGKKACRIKHAAAFDSFDRANWPAMTAWLIEHMGRLERAIGAPLRAASVAARVPDAAA
jgi:hypothetical protein